MYVQQANNIPTVVHYDFISSIQAIQWNLSKLDTLFMKKNFWSYGDVVALAR